MKCIHYVHCTQLLVIIQTWSQTNHLLHNLWLHDFVFCFAGVVEKFPVQWWSKMGKDHYLKKWETTFPWLRYDTDKNAMFCRVCHEAKKRKFHISHGNNFAMGGNRTFKHSTLKRHEGGSSAAKSGPADLKISKKSCIIPQNDSETDPIVCPVLIYIENQLNLSPDSSLLSAYFYRQTTKLLSHWMLYIEWSHCTVGHRLKKSSHWKCMARTAPRRPLQNMKGTSVPR